MLETILLAHGGGGLLTSQLVREAIVERFGELAPDRLDDSAILPSSAERLAFTTDSYTVSPVFFPGGDIGDLAVCGTINDLAMSGARPAYISLALILEEGLPRDDLDRILDSVKTRAEEAGVKIACGDTKVVPRGQADKIYVNTAGIGYVPAGVEVSSANTRPGDAIVISGPLGLHGLAVMLSRFDFHMETPLKSDVAPLNEISAALLEAGVSVHAMRDLTRGGLAMGLYDIAKDSGVTVEIDEAGLPADPAADAACELLGLDIVHVASEGCFIAVVDGGDAEKAVGIMRRFEPGKRAAVVGRILEEGRYEIEMLTAIGSRRVVTPFRGEQLPRIC